MLPGRIYHELELAVHFLQAIFQLVGARCGPFGTLKVRIEVGHVARVGLVALTVVLPASTLRRSMSGSMNHMIVSRSNRQLIRNPLNLQEGETHAIAGICLLLATCATPEGILSDENRDQLEAYEAEKVKSADLRHLSATYPQKRLSRGGCGED